MSYAIFDKTLSNITFNFNVGIGTSHALSSLHVQGVQFVNGSLGIGTTNPLQTFHVTNGSFFGSNVGIGSTNPTSLLDIRATTNTAALSIFQNTNTLPALRVATSRSVIPALFVGGDAQVGIGTGSPLQKLHVQGAQYINGNLGIGIVEPLANFHLNGTAKGVPSIYRSGFLSGTTFIFELDTSNYNIHEIYFTYIPTNSVGTGHNALVRTGAGDKTLASSYRTTNNVNNIFVAQSSGNIAVADNTIGDGPVVANFAGNNPVTAKITVFNSDVSGTEINLQTKVEVNYTRTSGLSCHTFGSFASKGTTDTTLVQYNLLNYTNNTLSGSSGEYVIVGYSI
jgi:hypothetical protein